MFEVGLQNQVVAGKDLFERPPLVGYFSQILPDGSDGEDFVLVNVHLASGQDRDENHLIATAMLEHALQSELARHAIRETAITILGDFNDNPVRSDDSGRLLTSPALVEHLQFKGYQNLVLPEMEFTRMNSKLNSLIDHVYVNEATRELMPELAATLHRPGKGKNGDPDTFADWRATFSDHFPITYEIRVGPDTDPDFFD